ncbi:MAG: ribonuclease P protein component, partial [Micromonosporaceae bacterium]
MLPAAARLRRRADFVTTVRRGRRRGHGAVVVHVRLAEPADHQADAQVRVGFVVSRAVGGAVARNRVRRRLQHVVAERLGSLPEGAALVVRALPDAAGRGYQQLAEDFEAALRGALNPRRRGSGNRRPRPATTAPST